MEKKIKYIKYIVIIIVLLGGIFLIQTCLGENDVATQKEDIELDQNGKQIIDNEGKSGKDNEATKGQIDRSTLSEEELKDYDNYDPLGRNANGQQTEGKE